MDEIDICEMLENAILTPNEARKMLGLKKVIREEEYINRIDLKTVVYGNCKSCGATFSERCIKHGKLGKYVKCDYCCTIFPI